MRGFFYTEGNWLPILPKNWRKLNILQTKKLPLSGKLFVKSRWRDSNPRPADYKSAALAS